MFGLHPFVFFTTHAWSKSRVLFIYHKATHKQTHTLETKLFDVRMSSAIRQTDVNCFSRTLRLNVISHSDTRRPMAKRTSHHGNKCSDDFLKDVTISFPQREAETRILIFRIKHAHLIVWVLDKNSPKEKSLNIWNSNDIFAFYFITSSECKPT